MADNKNEPKIKGLAFIEILKWYSRSHGAERINKAVASMPPHLRAYIANPDSVTLGLLSGSWYPAELVQHIFSHMTAGLTGQATRQLAADAVKASVGTTLNGIYKAFIRLLVSPEMIAEHYQKIWRLYHTSGECKVIIHDPTHHEMRLSKWPVHDAFLCLMNVYATKLILEITGCKDVSTSLISCVSKGGPYCAYEQRWSP
jgi:hypothetical protein